LNKKILIAFALLLLLPVFVGPAGALNQEVPIPNKNHLIYATIGDPEMTDPGKAYDTASAEFIMNVYETLIFWPFETVPTDPHAFEPQLADYWILPGDPGYPGVHPDAPAGTVETFYFHIRPNVHYHIDPDHTTTPNKDYGTVQASDVEYSIERGMIFDGIDGPQWMFYMVLLNGGSATDFDAVYGNDDGTISYDEAAIGGPMIDAAVESDNDTGMVWFNLAIPYPAFIQILAQSWGAVYPQAWGMDLAAEGRYFWPGWQYVTPGRTGATGYDSWIDYCDQVTAQLIAPTDNPYTRAIGTGPYKFDYWTKDETWQVLKFDNYWRGWPSDDAWAQYGGRTSSSYFDVFTHKKVVSWTARRDMFLSELADKQADLVTVPRAYIGQVETEPGVQGSKDIPTLMLSPAMYFNYAVRSDAIYFTTKPKLGAVEKLDLLSDKHMRKAMAHALDYDKYLIDAFLGEAFQPGSPIVKGLAQFNATKDKMHYSLALLEAELKLAWAGAPGGSAWDQGFYIPLTYNAGNEERRIACEMISGVINGLGAKYKTDVFPLDWGSAFLPAMKRKELTNFFVGWIWDYADADNGVVPFMHPYYGTYALRQSVRYTNIKAADFASNSGRANPATGMYRRYDGTVFNVDVTDLGNDYVADLIDDAAREGNAVVRSAMYSELEDIFYAASTCIPLAQPKARHWERDWMQGWYYNAIGPGGYGEYAYRMWKGLAADTNGDGKVDANDIAPINNYFWDAFWDPAAEQWVIISGPAGLFNRIADVSSPFVTGGLPRTWDLDGTEFVWKSYGLIAGNEIPGVDGYVNLYDQALVNAQLNDFITAY